MLQTAVLNDDRVSVEEWRGGMVTVRVRKTGGRRLDEQERVRMRLSVGEGRREGQTLCVPTLSRFPQ